ncbi:hypothetical protein LEP1GSC021_2198 [Leptospira noguchii str. 1993005606]|nr:hypothetical protein LEP1GSC021_2198 [Leptospira noguchii str. 1993005606]
MSSGSETLSSGKRCALVSNAIHRERCALVHSSILFGLKKQINFVQLVLGKN